ncbi:PUA-like domain-containing protein [Mycena floridula]|nr:PUA-like domain-containing protein [Mycena floridula]
MNSCASLLICPVCNQFLQSPTTLHCGHSVCSFHQRCICDQVVPDDPRPDVTLNKIISLVEGMESNHGHEDDDEDDNDLLAHLRNHSTSAAKFEKELLEFLTCEICFVPLYQPVTTPCQHSFCAKCLHRSLDHSTVCPLCRQQLPGFSYFQEHQHNQVIISILQHSFPKVYQARAEAIEAEEREARLNTPIFVCQLSFPGMPTLLHFFEPRYRLMLRRCLESPDPSFGMIMPPRPGASSSVDYGTMLVIRSVQFLNDGRAMVETWGTWRFRILERGQLDGYMVGRIERIEDFADDLEEQPSDADDHDKEPEASTSSAPSPSRIFHPRSGPAPAHPLRLTTRELTEHCLAFLNTLQNGTPWVSQRLSHTYGMGYGVFGPYVAWFTARGDGTYSLPPDTSLQGNDSSEAFDTSGFSFWVGAVLPIDDGEKAKLLPVKSVRMRLQMCVWWIEGLRRHWWFSGGCVIL